MPKLTVSERRLAANRANAQKSTGPKTSAGKAKSSLNAVKTGLTGNTVLLPSDDLDAYHDHVQRMNDALQPVGTLELQLVQTLADLQWRLNRIHSLESGFLALARRRCAPDLLADEPDGDIRAVLIEAHIQEAAAKSLEALHRQEQRLRRQYAGEFKELKRLQEERMEAARKAEIESALRIAIESIRHCSCESCQQVSRALFGRFGKYLTSKGAMASNLTSEEDGCKSIPNVVIVDDRQGSPRAA